LRTRGYRASTTTSRPRSSKQSSVLSSTLGAICQPASQPASQSGIQPHSQPASQPANLAASQPGQSINQSAAQPASQPCGNDPASQPASTPPAIQPVSQGKVEGGTQRWRALKAQTTGLTGIVGPGQAAAQVWLPGRQCTVLCPVGPKACDTLQAFTVCASHSACAQLATILAAESSLAREQLQGGGGACNPHLQPVEQLPPHEGRFQDCFILWREAEEQQCPL
jgi:hypothetical protein